MWCAAKHEKQNERLMWKTQKKTTCLNTKKNKQQEQIENVNKNLNKTTTQVYIYTHQNTKKVQTI